MMKTNDARLLQAGPGTMPKDSPIRGARELPDGLLDLVVGGAGEPTADVMARLVADGVVPPRRVPRRDG
jgi:hypothetical protein